MVRRDEERKVTKREVWGRERKRTGEDNEGMEKMRGKRRLRRMKEETAGREKEGEEKGEKEREDNGSVEKIG